MSSFEKNKRVMIGLPFFVGAAVGLAFGVILMILVRPGEQVEPIHELNLYDDEEQMHESGFIDIPIQRIVSENHRVGQNTSDRTKRRLHLFKMRNRFYK